MKMRWIALYHIMNEVILFEMRLNEFGALFVVYFFHDYFFKCPLNRASCDLNKLLQRLKNQSVQAHHENLSPTEATDYSLWSAARKLNKPQQNIPSIKDQEAQWARNKRRLICLCPTFF